MIAISIHYMLNILPYRLRTPSIERFNMKANFCTYFCSLIKQKRNTLVSIVTLSPPSNGKYSDIRFYMHLNMFPYHFNIITAISSEFRIEITGNVIIKTGYNSGISRRPRSGCNRMCPVLHPAIYFRIPIPIIIETDSTVIQHHFYRIRIVICICMLPVVTAGTYDQQQQSINEIFSHVSSLFKSNPKVSYPPTLELPD